MTERYPRPPLSFVLNAVHKKLKLTQVRAVYEDNCVQRRKGQMVDRP